MEGKVGLLALSHFGGLPFIAHQINTTTETSIGADETAAIDIEPRDIH